MRLGAQKVNRPLDDPGRGFFWSYATRYSQRMNMRWPKRLAKWLGSQASPIPPTETPNATAPTPQKRPYVCVYCQRARKSPHQVRAGRARARNAPRDQRGRFLSN